MIKDIMAANESVTLNDKEIAILKENFPSCFRPDGSFDMVCFSEYLKDKIEISHEGYELKFLGKSYAKMLASLDTETVIVPDDVHNSLPENANSENVYITGDNLDGLNHLLKSYAGQVKCIYIDPPYNTGFDDFVYNDKFDFTINDLIEKLSIDEDHAKHILDLTSRGSSSHSAWLMFMYPRLLLARDLLADNGVTFISIGKDEVANLRILCDSVMGEDNLVGIISRVMKSGGGKGQFFSPNIDYILVYARNISSLTKFRTPVSKKTIKSYYKNMQTEGERAGELYGEERIYVAGLDARPNQRYWIECPDGSFVIPEGVAMPDRIEDGCQVTPLDGDGCWKWTYESYLREKKDGNIVFKQTSSSPLFDENGNQSKYNLYNKVWLSDKEGSVPGDYLSQFENRLSSSELKKIDIPFDFAKPTALISYLIDLCTSKDDDGFFVVDFFSGSASTAHAVMNMNAENDTKIKYIMIQLPEPVKKNSKEEKAGFKTIDQIGQERIIRAAKKIKEEYPETTTDFGFKHYTLQDVSQSTLDKMESFDNSGFVTNTTVYDEFGANTVLTTWLVHDGYGFSNNMEMVDLAGYTAYWCRNHLYFINPGMAEDAIKALIEKYNSQGNFNPQNIILFGYSFNYVEMENLKANVKMLRDSEKNLKINLDIRY